MLVELGSALGPPLDSFSHKEPPPSFPSASFASPTKLTKFATSPPTYLVKPAFFFPLRTQYHSNIIARAETIDRPRLPRLQRIPCPTNQRAETPRAPYCRTGKYRGTGPGRHNMCDDLHDEAPNESHETTPAKLTVLACHLCLMYSVWHEQSRGSLWLTDICRRR